MYVTTEKSLIDEPWYSTDIPEAMAEDDTISLGLDATLGLAIWEVSTELNPEKSRVRGRSSEESSLKREEKCICGMIGSDLLTVHPTPPFPPESV